jgi:pimeloyl-ACP methyl ester carboxylesterase
LKSIFLWPLLIAGLAYTAFCLLLYVSQRSMMYMPTAESEAQEAEAFTISSAGHSLKIWRLGNASSAILYFGGNAENVAWNIPTFGNYFPDFSIYLPNYRGYGGSGGSPSEKGFYRDALNIYDLIKGRHDKIYVIGRSIGAAVATFLAAHREVDRLVLITPFDSALNMAKEIYPYIPVTLLLKDRLDAARYAGEVSAPVHVIVAAEDGIVPRARTDALINAFAPDQLEVDIIERATHNDIDGFEDYRVTLISSLFEKN